MSINMLEFLDQYEKSTKFDWKVSYDYPRPILYTNVSMQQSPFTHDEKLFEFKIDMIVTGVSY